ncbi:hypothetical protein [Mesobacterium pallidum]|uniref:hypothetical protein n=1 Tax=Mesobacterium pallidum TaxID=2872037 RepID=UPI001EE29D0F|nr:hypothetical protein [Mesobacterium pallidum]
MGCLADVSGLDALGGAPGAWPLREVVTRMTSPNRQRVVAARVCVPGSPGAEGSAGWPGGDDGQAVVAVHPGTLAMPDRPGRAARAMWRAPNPATP